MADFDVHYDPITVNSSPVTVNTTPVTVHLEGLDDVKLSLETPKPVESRSEFVFQQPFRTELSIPKPIVLDAKTALDVKPLALDQCLHVELGPLPPTCVRQPYRQHVGFTLFGVELFGVDLSGESQVLVSPMRNAPHVAWGGAEARHGVPARQQARPHRATEQGIERSGGGLRIRLGE